MPYEPTMPRLPLTRHDTRAGSSMYDMVGHSVSQFWCVCRHAWVPCKHKSAAALVMTPGKPPQACSSLHLEGRHLLLHLWIGHHCLHLCHFLLHCWVLHLLLKGLHALLGLPTKEKQHLAACLMSNMCRIQVELCLFLSRVWCSTKKLVLWS